MVFLCLTAQIEMYIRKMDVAKSYPHGHTKNAFVFSFILDFIICYILLNIPIKTFGRLQDLPYKGDKFFGRYI